MTPASEQTEPTRSVASDEPVSEAPRMLFVVGSRRSGTLWLHRILASHPDVAAVPSETHLFSHGIAPLFERFHHGAIGSTLTGAIYVDRATIVARVRALCDAVFEPYHRGGRYLLERTPLHVRELELIREIYPDARVVHIIRDGRAAARSLALQGWGPGSVGAAAAEWRDSVQAGRDAAQPAELYREVRYEGLLDDPKREVRGLLEWLGLEAGATTIAAALEESRAEANLGPASSGRGAGASAGQWSEADLEEFEAEAGELLGELGYETGSCEGGLREPSPSAFERIGGAARRRIRRRATEAAAVGEAHLDQMLADELIAYLVGDSAEQLGELLTETASVELIEPAGRTKVRGAEARALLETIAGSDPAFAAPQLSGETRIGTPWSSTVLRFAAVEGGVFSRVVCTSARGERLEDVAIYRLD